MNSRLLIYVYILSSPLILNISFISQSAWSTIYRRLTESYRYSSMKCRKQDDFYEAELPVMDISSPAEYNDRWDVEIWIVSSINQSDHTASTTIVISSSPLIIINMATPWSLPIRGPELDGTQSIVDCQRFQHDEWGERHEARWRSFTGFLHRGCPSVSPHWYIQKDWINTSCIVG